MSEYRPDKWLVVKITGPDDPPIHKVFGSWYGGYLGTDSWKLNSGITKVTLEKSWYLFEGSSGSVYSCNRDSYGASGYGYTVLNDMIERVKDKGISFEILPAETNWLEIHYE